MSIFDVAGYIGLLILALWLFSCAIELAVDLLDGGDE